MSFTREWCNFFNIPEKDVKSWLEQAKSAENFTFWSLKNNKIDNNKYLQWAKNHYHLPVLKSHYFEQAVDTSWWSIVKSISNWSEKLIPIAEWDNTIFIACLEPRTDIHWSFPVQFVLASSHDLEKRWKELNKTVQVESNTQTQTDLKATEQVIITPPPPAPAPASPPPPAPTVNVVKAEEPEKVSIDAPEGMEGLNLNVPSNAPAAEGFDVPEGMNIEAPAGMEGLNLSLANNSQPAEGFAAPEGMNLEAPAGMEGLNLEVPNNSQTPEGLVAPVAVKDPSAPLNSHQLESVVGFNPEVQKVFSELSETYNAVMVLMFESDKLRHWANDGNWRPKGKGALLPIDISDPCIFKIVKVSGQPFHGPISSNQINDTFFQNWGFSSNPEHVSITPVKYDSFIAGMVLAVGTKEKSSSMTSLNLLEKVTEKLKPLLETLSPAA
ncbi:MAG: hypothetical protein KDD58_08080 [Bdellovibrionales bacterium]|nr:hypothetical protein [Bdellovibrionales bacterium]